MKHGPSEDASNTIGPLISTRAVAKAASHVTDALSKGATVAFGPSAAPPVPSEGGFFYPPTVLTGLTDDMQISVEETFAPVAAIRKFETIEEVLKAANDSTVGLGSYGERPLSWFRCSLLRLIPSPRAPLQCTQPMCARFSRSVRS